MSSIIYVGVLAGAILLGLSLPIKKQQPEKQNWLAAFTWQKRVLLLFRPNTADPAGKAQLEQLQKVPHALADRDLELLVISGDNLEGEKSGAAAGNDLRHQFKIAPTTFTLLLTGKDGGEKYRTNKVANPQEIFKIIDAMPMRQLVTCLLNLPERLG